MAKGDIRLKRVYEPATEDDGTRIFVERLWPRGISKDRAQFAEWTRDLAPTPELRRWYSHKPERWPEFRERYLAELRSHSADLERLRALARSGRLTLVYAASDEHRNSAVVLKEALEGS